ncbi:hypothetical protein BDQ12DRAFT_254758 [Crucibulum laeve]|uniref:Uncharacterized protein n=1 Tax=Crucibulum laeve TaxID=68775 RepID=A0A5C3LSX6_9AGAR|nr:hypothetical protein BDQ12DRAFT_254758 [Crucibulum laeve]
MASNSKYSGRRIPHLLSCSRNDTMPYNYSRYSVWMHENQYLQYPELNYTISFL